MKQILNMPVKTVNVAGLAFMAIFICTGVQADENYFSLAVAIGNAMESSVEFNMFFKFICAVLGVSPVVCLLNYAASTTGLKK
jgi:hypothetical protein